MSEEASLTLNGQAVSLEDGNTFICPVTLGEGANPFSLAAVDRAGNNGTESLTLTLDTIPPAAVDSSKVSLGSASGGTVTVSAVAASAEAGTQVRVTNERTGQSVTGTTASNGSFSVAISAQAGDSLSITLTDVVGNTSSATSVSVSADPPPDQTEPPPDPATVAPPLDPTVSTSIGSATSFLYTGSNPIQTGVSAETIEPRRAAVIRGKVLAGDGTALPGVTISILNHPEFGRTISRADGMFDMAVNGGGQLTVDYKKSGYLPSQRQINIPWRDYVSTPDVVMIQPDSRVSAIDLSSIIPIQVARASTITDSDGTRTATLFFTQGTTAAMTLPDGSTRPVSSLNVRATEYTVGSTGPNAMPAPLPPTSAYTYCVELSTDEALAAGAQKVTFSSPVIQYVENFIGFPAGTHVPVGFYDRTKGQWIPSDDGRVIRILSFTSGMADLDIDGSNQAADPTALASLGVTDAERTQLASLYSTGQSLWRVAVSHFCIFDFNFPWGLPTGAVAPGLPVDQTRPVDDPCVEGGSIIGCESQSLGEEIAVTGTRVKLHYQNDRETGHIIDRTTIVIPLTGATVQASLKSVALMVSVAGRQFHSTFPATPNQTTAFSWDGYDVYGRLLQGSQPVTIKTGYVYQAVYCQTGSGAARSFASVSGVPITGTDGNRIYARTELTLWQTQESTIGSWNALGEGLGGWTLDVHHFYDTVARKLYLGDGSQRSAKGMAFNVISTFAGNGTENNTWNGFPATQTGLYYPTDVAAGPDGSIYIAVTGTNCIIRVGPDGIITRVAGIGTSYGFSGDGGPATEAGLNFPTGVAVGADGSIYIADRLNGCIRRVGPDGIINTVAGNGTRGHSGDGGPATQASLTPYSVAVGPDNSIYIAAESNCVRRIGPDGIITTVAGNGTYGYSGDGGPAAEAEFRNISGVAVAHDGSIYVADYSNSRIRRVGPDGIVTTVAGNGTYGYSGDGGPATQATLTYPTRVAVGPDGSIYISEYWTSRIRRVGPDGIITTLAGNGSPIYSGDGGPATKAGLKEPHGIAVGSDGRIYIADSNNNRVRVVANSLPGFIVGDILIPSKDGIEIYHFNSSGRHLSTVHTLTGAILYQFAFDSSGHLSTITDGNGNTITIDHDGSGNPTAIISPYGQHTTLAVDPNGYLADITDPATNAYNFTYTTDGLMLGMTNPNNKTYQFIYDSYGRLTKDSDPEGGSKTLARRDLSSGYSVAVTTGLNRITNYSVQQLSTGWIDRVTVFPDATRTKVTTGTDGSKRTTYPDGRIRDMLQGPDSRFGMLSALPTSTTTTTPGGIAFKTAMSRTVSLSNAINPLSLTSQTDTVSINGRKYISSFSASTNTFTITSPTGRQRTSTIDAMGKVVLSRIAGLDPTSYVYDSRGRLSAITTGTGTNTRTMSLAYDTGGLLSSFTDTLGQASGYQYDAAGRVISRSLPDGNLIGFEYDGNGNLTSITPPGQPAHVFTYTSVDLDSSYSPPGSSVTDYIYNIDRQLVEITRPGGEILSFAYDSAGRLSNLNIPDGQITYGYDAATGKLKQVTTSDGIGLALTYDGFLPKSGTWSGAISGKVGYTYDNDFRLSSISLNDSNSISYQYDADSFLTKAGDLALTRNSQNGLLTATSLGSLADSRTYNSFGEPASYTASYGGSVLFSTQYTRDQLGRITQKTETVDGATNVLDYTYDQAGRLSQVEKNGSTIATYAYDANGNRLSRTDSGGTTTGAYDDQDRLTQYGTTTYTYSANGELLGKTAGTATTSYQYDVLGNLKQVSLPNGSVIDYMVDGANRRIGKKLNGALVQGFLYQDRLRPIAELDGSNNVVSRFVYATGNTPAYMIRNGVKYRIISDHLGSPRLIVNSTTGDIAQQMDYDEFGNVVSDTNPGFQPFGFAGGIYDRDTRLTRFGARDFDAGTGRWTAKDPILFKGLNTNLYGYCLADPINRVDPFGLVNYKNAALSVAQVAGGLATLVAGYTYTLETGGIGAFLGGAALAGIGSANLVNGALNFVDAILDVPWGNTNGPCENVGSGLYGDNGSGAGKLIDTATDLQGLATSKGPAELVINGVNVANDLGAF